MNVYALFPLVAAIAFMPLLVTTIATRPRKRQHKLFIMLLIPAMLWSLTDFFFRGNFFPQHSLLLAKLIVVLFAWMAVQFHCFSSSFYSPRESRWLPFAYATLAMAITIVALGYFPRGVIAKDVHIYIDWGRGFILMAPPFLAIVARNMFVFRRKLKYLDNPILYNQILSVMLGMSILTISTLASFLPWGRELPISHLGNIVNAAILSYATVRHQLVDIKLVLRRGLAWASLGAVGILGYWLLLVALHNLFRFQIDPTTALAATVLSTLVAVVIYKLRNSFLATVSKVLQGQSYDYRQKLSNFASNIHKVFSLREQGGELLALVTRAIGCRKASLLFLENGSDDFTAQLVEPNKEDNPLRGLRLTGNNPIVEYLKRERKPLTRVNLDILPEFRSLWQREKDIIKQNGIELFTPLISRDRLVGILVLDKKQTGRYSLEDFNLLEEVTNRVAVSIEKEYINEQLREREEELKVINRSSVVLSSSMDIQGTYDSFMKELKKTVDVNWAAIILTEGDELYFMALSSDTGSAWKAGERLPIKGTAIEWVASNRKTVIEPDLSRENRFAMGKYFLEQGIRSAIYLPLIANGKVLGSLVVASRLPNAYDQRSARLLKELAMQIAVPVENSRLYAAVEQKARVDWLTGLLNRQSLDELLSSEISRHSRYGGVFSLIILDLDSFKAFNDAYGHPAGDRLLHRVGNVMKSSIRSSDYAFRYGGDEFSILLPQTGIQAAYEVAERVRTQIAKEAKTEYVPITASIGLASWPADGIGATEIIVAADKALFRAKRSGGNSSLRYSNALPLSDEEVSSRQDGEDSKALSAIYALASTVDARDHYSCSHSKKVNECAITIAEALKLSALEISRLSTCAFLHDIGKIGIGDDILSKPDKLSMQEWTEVKVHPQLGAAIVSHARQLAPCIPGILHHHERFDGSGYPAGLKGKEIPLEARILAIADAFAAITSERHYSQPLSFEEALKEIERGAGTQFDPDLVEVFIQIMKTPATRIREWVESGTQGM
ncbi:MAG: diguanylate cyclase [Chloroflexi bacterium]|nr:diguanylate cyclase [Chloroflexota bacterium]